MKKKKVAQIYFQVTIDGKPQMLMVTEEELRKSIEAAKIKKDAQQDIILRFMVNGQNLEISLKMADINRLLKQAKLKTTQLIPNSLNGYLEDITQKLVENPTIPIVKREHEIEKIWFYLSQKRRNNVFITGEMDAGKTAIAYEIARQMSTNECPKEFHEKHVLLLRPQLLARIKSDRAYERTVKKVMNFLVENRKSIVLCIDNAIYMKTDELLIMMLYACVTKYHIPMMATLNYEDYERYFLADTNIAKCLNEVYVEEPEMDELKSMLETHIPRLEKRYKVKITDEAIKFGVYTACLSESPSAEPGNAVDILEKASREARRKGKKEVDKQCILSCYNTSLKDYENMPEEERRATAYHETGHYIAHIMSENQKDVKVSCVSILPMMWWAGATISYREPKEYAVYSREYFVDQIAISLAGRIAEKKVTYAKTAGASNDLMRTNSTAKAIVMRWGFSENAYNKNRSYDYEDYFLMPESKKELIDMEVQKLIDEGMERAEEMIDNNEGLLKEIAESLMVDEILTGEELEQICKEYKESHK